MKLMTRKQQSDGLRNGLGNKLSQCICVIIILRLQSWQVFWQYLRNFFGSNILPQNLHLVRKTGLGWRAFRRLWIAVFISSSFSHSIARCSKSLASGTLPSPKIFVKLLFCCAPVLICSGRTQMKLSGQSLGSSLLTTTKWISVLMLWDVLPVVFPVPLLNMNKLGFIGRYNRFRCGSQELYSGSA